MADFPNVSRSEWDAMRRKSEALQRRAQHLLLRGEKGAAVAALEELRPILKHIKAISDLPPLEG